RGSNDVLPTHVGATGGLPASVTTDPALADKLPVAPAAIPETLRATEHWPPILRRGDTMADESIPLWDGEPLGAKIIPQETSSGGDTQTLRSRRRSPRKSCDRVHVCFSPNLASGLVEYVECPVLDMSVSGFALEYDEKLDVGMRGYVSYMTIGRRPVRVSCCVRRCKSLGRGRYLLGIQLDRKLNAEERTPSKANQGRQVALGARPRRLRDLRTADDLKTADET
ncbi:MAG: PilZ domain-containing protein, partial [Phycisphaerae bacterium]|nr:PilZ domain-containing protein [Phycisphaerae bacterium]